MRLTSEVLTHNYDSFYNANVDSKNNSKVITDYIKFFLTEEGSEMTSYIYLDSENYYDHLIRNSEDYYLCRDHIQLISDNINRYKEYLEDVVDVIEFGPGSEYVMKNKTIKMLYNLPKLKKLHIVDNCRKYLEETLSVAKRWLNDIDVYTVEADLMQKGKIILPDLGAEKKCLLFLGGTLSNFHVHEQNFILKKFYEILSDGDLFMLTADANQDKKSLIDAYSNKHAENLFMGIIHNFARINEDFRKYKDMFKMETLWNEEGSFVDISFVSIGNFSFYMPNYGMIDIKKNQRCRGVRAYKRLKEQTRSILENNGFEVIDVLGDDKKIQEFVCIRR